MFDPALYERLLVNRKFIFWSTAALVELTIVCDFIRNETQKLGFAIKSPRYEGFTKVPLTAFGKNVARVGLKMQPSDLINPTKLLVCYISECVTNSVSLLQNRTSFEKQKIPVSRICGIQ